MEHSHTHDHSASHRANGREGRLWAAFGLTAAMLLLELVGGFVSQSLALLADAAHMLVDALALLMAVVAARVAQRPADAWRSYGYGRVEVLAGFVSGLLQVMLTVFIVVKALQRLVEPAEILSGVMLWVAVAGLLVNAVILSTLHRHDPDDVNMSGAALHVLGDLLGSVAAVAAAILVSWLGWLRADPVLSLLVSVMILRSAWKLLRRTGHILLEGAPEDVEANAMITALREADPGVCNVHHLHVWQLASGSRIATLHAGLYASADGETAMRAIKQMLAEDYRIDHVTVQIEPGTCPDETSDDAS